MSELEKRCLAKRPAEDLVLAHLESIAVALDRVQSDQCAVAEAVNIWKELIISLCSNRCSNCCEKKFSQLITHAQRLANQSS